MLARLIPRDEQFFTLFDQLADHLASAARLLSQLFAEPSGVVERVRAIKDVEHQADLLTANINKRIDRSFVTPLDREDIHSLSIRLDDVIDLIDGTARHYEMLHISDTREAARRLCDVLVRATESIRSAVGALRTPARINEIASGIKTLEEEADAIYHDAMGALFSGHPDPLDVLRWKEMYDLLERASDSCMGVAQALQSIAIKNA